MLRQKLTLCTHFVLYMIRPKFLCKQKREEGEPIVGRAICKLVIVYIIEYYITYCNNIIYNYFELPFFLWHMFCYYFHYREKYELMVEGDLFPWIPCSRSCCWSETLHVIMSVDLVYQCNCFFIAIPFHTTSIALPLCASYNSLSATGCTTSSSAE